MSRTAGVQDHDAGLRTRLLFWLVKRRLGRIPLSTRISALDPKLLGLSLKMSMYTSRHIAVAPKLKELAQLKVAAMVGCTL